MAHEIDELAEGIHAYVGAVTDPWHKLGMTLPATFTAEEALRAPTWRTGTSARLRSPRPCSERRSDHTRGAGPLRHRADPPGHRPP